MKIYVCVKHVPDTAATIRVAADGCIDENITFIMNPYDENAVEEAVRLKKKVGSAEVVAVTLGSRKSRQAERWGPFFLPAYVLASLAVGLRGRRWYLDNPFEIEARVLSDHGS